MQFVQKWKLFLCNLYTIYYLDNNDIEDNFNYLNNNIYYVEFNYWNNNSTYKK